MRDVNVSEAGLQGVCGTRVATVFCSTHWKLTKVTALKSEWGESHMKLWDIVECPLRPEGDVWCDKRCLDQIDDDVRPR
jgi:hypothetical protein